MDYTDVIDLSSDGEGNIEDNCPNVSIKQEFSAEGNWPNASIKSEFSVSPSDEPGYPNERTSNVDIITQVQNCTVQSIQSSPLQTAFRDAQEPPSRMIGPQCAAQSGLSRQFWKAGDYDVQSTSTKTMQRGIDHVRVHPKFLHSNATSHKWALGAIAELLDNAVDEIQNGATFVSVDNIINPRDNSAALLVQDDGGGMDPDCMRQCMSLGYSQKNTSSTIGQYGNGFKTSTMRLGADVIVFSSCNRNSISTQSIGLLSYTFLRETGHEDIVVPMVDYELSSSARQRKSLIRSNVKDWSENLSTLLQWSPYSTEPDLLKQFDDIGLHGTKVIIYNLWLNDDGQKELDFESDNEDIQLRGSSKVSKSDVEKELSAKHIANRLRYSLRAYSSVLYLQMPNNFKIILRGRPVEQHHIVDDLKFPELILYKPQVGGMKEVSVITTIGFTKEAPLLNVHGFNVYHRNRLIIPFWRVVHENSSRGRGVVGILEANFIEPAHDKQDFERTAVFTRLETRLKQMTMEYWNLHCELIGYKKPIRTNNATKISSGPLPSVGHASLPAGSCAALPQSSFNFSTEPGHGSAGVANTLGAALPELPSAQMPLPIAILRTSSSFNTVPLPAEIQPEEGNMSRQLIISGTKGGASTYPDQGGDIKPVISRFDVENQAQLCPQSHLPNFEKVLIRDVKPDLSRILRSRGIPPTSNTSGEPSRGAVNVGPNISLGRFGSGSALGPSTPPQGSGIEEFPSNRSNFQIDGQTAPLMNELNSVQTTDQGDPMIRITDSGCFSDPVSAISTGGPCTRPLLKRKISDLPLSELGSSKRQCTGRDSIANVQSTSCDAGMGCIPTSGELSSTENQIMNDHEVEELQKENTRLKVRIHEYEIRLQEIQQTVTNLEDELQTLHSNYAKLLIEAQSLATMKSET